MRDAVQNRTRIEQIGRIERIIPDYTFRSAKFARNFERSLICIDDYSTYRYERDRTQIERIGLISPILEEFLMQSA